jgi:hypothetical protein
MHEYRMLAWEDFMSTQDSRIGDNPRRFLAFVPKKSA